MKSVLLPFLTLISTVMPLLRIIHVADSVKASCWSCQNEDEDLLQAEPILTSGEKSIYQTINHKNRKMQWLGCRLALASVIDLNPVPISYNNHGKPYLAGSAGFLSLSHSGTLAAAIYSSLHPVGIDIELIRSRIERVANRFLLPEELAFLPGAGRMEPLTLCWSVKEAVYKIFGTPEIDLQRDIVIEPFEYLCSPSGTLTARLRVSEKVLPVEIRWYRLEEAMLACAILKEEQ